MTEPESWWQELPEPGPDANVWIEYGVAYGQHQYKVTGNSDWAIRTARIWGNGAYARMRIRCEYPNGWEAVGPWVKIEADYSQEALSREPPPYGW